MARKRADEAPKEAPKPAKEGPDILSGIKGSLEVKMTKGGSFHIQLSGSCLGIKSMEEFPLYVAQQAESALEALQNGPLVPVVKDLRERLEKSEVALAATLERAEKLDGDMKAQRTITTDSHKAAEMVRDEYGEMKVELDELRAYKMQQEIDDADPDPHDNQERGEKP